ncbi:hypothetical protein ACH4E8_25995 [Streptomyces sp. NPDC017979]|uniref:restriction endonuclease-related protein n=1 Tax=Streptomyces sp. NPDC017979 TaxID=3365024 RepID=UPI0037A0C6BC
MTDWIAPPSDDPDMRVRRVVTAALRAAYAWSVRDRQSAAYLEVARMTGVVMEAHGPGGGPTTPLELAASLRAELGALLPHRGEDEAIAAAVLLNDRDQLTPTALDLASEYAVPLESGTDPAAWLPSWTHMNAAHIRRETFALLTASNEPDAYVTSRKFLIEYPAGHRDQLGEIVAATGVSLPWNGYQELTPDQVHHVCAGVGWWWPCPECRWPMTVRAGTVRCRYLPHAARYQIVTRHAKEARPELSRIDEGPRATKPRASSVRGAVRVDPGVWRFVVVPGANELRIAGLLEKLGCGVRLWPERDSYDLHVSVRPEGPEFRLDLKEYRSSYRLCADLRASRPRATVLLPHSHEHQYDAVRSALPALDITTESRFKSRVRRLLSVQKWGSRV